MAEFCFTVGVVVENNDVKPFTHAPRPPQEGFHRGAAVNGFFAFYATGLNPGGLSSVNSGTIE
jgi:hypothetical protein